MIRNYFTVAWRNITKNKAFSFINIIGLALGMTCSLLILLWVYDERSVDNSSIVNEDRLFKVYQRQYTDGRINTVYNTPALLAAEMKRVIPEIQYSTATDLPENATFQVGDKITKDKVLFADSDYFKMFSYPLLEGKSSTALNSPVSLAISNKMARQFFGSSEAAIGKTIRYENFKDLKVTAVFADLPSSVSVKFDCMISWQTFLALNDWAKGWGNNGSRTYFMLKANADPIAVKTKIKKFLDAYNPPTAGYRAELDMQPFSEVYLHSSFKNGQIEGGRIVYVRLFSVVAIFILVIACINFMNLTTARSGKRAREIGIRKVAGALRWSLMGQFLTEAVFISSLSVIISLILVVLLLPSFSQLTGKQLTIPFSNIPFCLSIPALALVTGLLAGSYPAFFLSSFKPIRVLKGKLKSSQGNGLLRKGLVVFQFILSIVLIIGTLIVSKQVKYVQQINLGYDRENLLYVPLDGELPKNFELFRSRALNTPGVTEVSSISEDPDDIDNSTGAVRWEGKTPNSSPQFTQIVIGYDFVKTMGLKIMKGRDFSRSFATDSTGYIVNETALKIINYKDPIGKPLTLFGKKGHIVGVLKDFHFMSLHDHIRPLIARMDTGNTYGLALVRLEAGRTPQALDGLEKIVKTLNPKFLFTYSFSEEEYQQLYTNEQIVSRLANVFAALAIFISCMGLLGLTMFTAEQRAKELSIRKMLGASLGSLFTLLSREFVALVLVAVVIASPIAWLSMDRWLQDYAYRTPIEWWIFGLAGISAMLIALVTVSFQAVKAALINPVKSLRSE